MKRLLTFFIVSMLMVLSSHADTKETEISKSAYICLLREYVSEQKNYYSLLDGSPSNLLKPIGQVFFVEENETKKIPLGSGDKKIVLRIIRNNELINVGTEDENENPVTISFFIDSIPFGIVIPATKDFLICNPPKEEEEEEGVLERFQRRLKSLFGIE